MRPAPNRKRVSSSIPLVLASCAASLLLGGCGLPPPKIPGRSEPAPPPSSLPHDDPCDVHSNQGARERCREAMKQAGKR